MLFNFKPIFCFFLIFSGPVCLAAENSLLEKKPFSDREYIVLIHFTYDECKDEGASNRLDMYADHELMIKRDVYPDEDNGQEPWELYHENGIYEFSVDFKDGKFAILNLNHEGDSEENEFSTLNIPEKSSIKIVFDGHGDTKYIGNLDQEQIYKLLGEMVPFLNSPRRIKICDYSCCAGEGLGQSRVAGYAQYLADLCSVDVSYKGSNGTLYLGNSKQIALVLNSDASEKAKTNLFSKYFEPMFEEYIAENTDSLKEKKKSKIIIKRMQQSSAINKWLYHIPEPQFARGTVSQSNQLKKREKQDLSKEESPVIKKNVTENMI